MKVIVIGGGASGLASAIYASRNNDVTILEKNSSVGKKILVTGNGKCNYFNKDFTKEHFTNKDSFINEVITKKNINMVKDFFDEIGIVGKENNGYYYPMSGQAVSIQNILKDEVINRNVDIKYDTTVNDISFDNNHFVIKTNNGIYTSDKVIFSSGSRALYNTDVEVNNYNILRKLGHTIIDIVPGLSKLYSSMNFKDISGVRTDAKVSLYSNNKFIKSEVGELQFIDKGISGICIMQLSNYANKLSNNVIKVNFFDKLNITNKKELLFFLNERNNKLNNRNISELFDSIINYKLSNYLLRISHIDLNRNFDDLSKEELDNLSKNLIDFEIPITGYSDFKDSQICLGGVSTKEIDPLTMESKIVPGLYITGEAIDVNGDCGGYNLGFAWISGILAGLSVGEDDD